MSARILITLLSLILFSSHGGANFVFEGLLWRESNISLHNNSIWMKIFEPVKDPGEDEAGSEGGKLVFLIADKDYDIGNIWCDRQKNGQRPKTKLLFAKKGISVFQTHYVDEKRLEAERVYMQNAFIDIGSDKKRLVVARVSTNKNYDSSRFLAALKGSTVAQGEFLFQADSEDVRISLPIESQISIWSEIFLLGGATFLLGVTLYFLPFFPGVQARI